MGLSLSTTCLIIAYIHSNHERFRIEFNWFFPRRDSDKTSSNKSEKIDQMEGGGGVDEDRLSATISNQVYF